MRTALVTAACLGAVAGCGGASPASGVGMELHALGAQLVPGAIPADQGGPMVVEIDSYNNSIYPGQRGKKIKGLLGPGSRAVLVGFGDDTGYWSTPAGVPDVINPGDFDFEVSLEFSDSLPAGDRPLLFRAANAAGQLGPARPLILHVIPSVPAGLLVVSLAWDTETDLDLHVVQPDGTEIWAKNINAFVPPGPGQPPADPDAVTAGGILDFDSNPQCQIDGRRQENVVWRKTAPSGHYLVRVDAFSLCDEVAARWTLEAHRQDQALGRASGQMGEADTRGKHQAGSGLLALEFDIP